MSTIYLEKCVTCGLGNFEEDMGEEIICTTCGSNDHVPMNEDEIGEVATKLSNFIDFNMYKSYKQRQEAEQMAQSLEEKYYRDKPILQRKEAARIRQEEENKRREQARLRYIEQEDGCIHNSNYPMCVWGTKDGKCNWDQSEAVCGYDLGSNICAFVDRVPIMLNNTFQGCSTVANSSDCTGYYQFDSDRRESQPCIQDSVTRTCSAAVTWGVCYDRCLSNTNHFRQLCNGSSSTEDCLQRMGEDTLGRNYCTQGQRTVLANNFIPPIVGANLVLYFLYLGYKNVEMWKF